MKTKTCKCSNTGVLSTFKFCPYCGDKFVTPPKRYRYEGQGLECSRRGSYAINTGVKRPPKKGEYYLSGATPMAYKAPNDLSQAYLIAEIIDNH
jgi:hypothetical protein